MQSAALLFLGSPTVEPAGGTDTLEVPMESVLSLALRGLELDHLWADAGLRPQEMLERRLQVRLVQASGRPRIVHTEPGVGAKATLRWRPTPPEHAIFTFDGPTGAVIAGFVGSVATKAGMLHAELQSAFGALMLAHRPGAVLFTGLSAAQNAGMVWNADRTSVGDAWGTGPPLLEPLLGEVRVRFDSPHAAIYPLDETGLRRRKIPCKVENGWVSFDLRGEERTVWWEITAATGFEP